MYLHPDDIQGADVCFLLSVNWLGMEYRFSTVPIDITNTATGQVFRYMGGLSDPTIQQSSKSTAQDTEGDSVNVELVFIGINWIQEWLAGQGLVNSECVLGMVPMTQGATSFTYEDIIILHEGVVSEPIYGTPDKPIGHVIFSIENSLSVVKVKLLENQNEIDIFQFPGLDQRAASLGRTIQYPVGKYVPFVFGELGVWIQRNETSIGIGVEYLEQAQVSPAYTINATGSGVTLETTYVIAQGEVASSTIRVWDETGGNFVNTVETETNTDGALVSVVKYQLGSVIDDNSFAPGLDTDQTFWVSWGEYEGGSLDPISGESLAPATNLILYVLDKTGLKFNRDKWMGLSGLLNRYRFSGYVNDPEVVAMEWLQTQILQFLPVSVFNGEGGLEPRVNLYHYTDNIHPAYFIEENGLFQALTGIQPLDVEVVNKVVLKFCWAGQFSQFLSTVTIDPTLEEENGMAYRDPISDISFQRYGLKEEVVECPFIWDFDTAIRVARDIIRTRGLGMYAMEIEASPQYGYIQVGEVIAFTSQNFGLEKHKCQVIQKSWSGNTWKFVLHLESNSFVNPRQLV